MRQTKVIKMFIWVWMIWAMAGGLVMAEERRARGIALVDSEFTRKIYQKQRANYQLVFSPWYEAVRRHRADLQVLKGDDLARKDLTNYSALILPGSVALSDPDLKAVQRFVRSGGGLLLGGASGTLTPNGKWRGWDFIKELTGLKDVQAFRRKEYKSLYLTLLGGSPLTANLSPGLRIENLFYTENYGGISEQQDAYWADYFNPIFLPNSPNYYTAIKTAHYGRGRVAWFGFSLESMHDHPESQAALLVLFGNTLRWLGQEAVGQVAVWPQAQKTAASLTFDCEGNFYNLANLLNRKDVPSFHFTFFMLSSMAADYPELIPRAAAMGEVAIHGDDHSSFRGQSYETQFQRLARAQQKLRALSGTDPISFRPPYQRFDMNTLLVLKKLGLINFFADYNLSSTPYFQVADRSPRGSSDAAGSAGNLLVTFPRPGYDDYDLFVRYQFSNDEAIRRILEDFERVDKERGHYVLNMHTTEPWGGLTQRKIEVLATLIRKLENRNDLWLPSIREVGDWWRMRRNLDLRVLNESNERLNLTITNRNDKPVQESAVEIYLPDGYSDIRIDPVSSDSQISWRLDNSEGKLVIILPILQPREARRYVVTLGKPGE